MDNSTGAISETGGWSCKWTGGVTFQKKMSSDACGTYIQWLVECRNRWKKDLLRTFPAMAVLLQVYSCTATEELQLPFIDILQNMTAREISPGNPTRAGPCVRALDFAEDLNDAALWCFRWRSLCRLTCVTTTNVLDRWDTHVVVYGFQANSVRLVKKIVTQKFSGHATRFQLFLLFSIQKYKLSLWLFSKVWILFPVTKLIFLLQVNQKATNQLTRVRRGSQRPTGQHLNIYFTQHKCCCMKHYLYWL